MSIAVPSGKLRLSAVPSTPRHKHSGQNFLLQGNAVSASADAIEIAPDCDYPQADPSILERFLLRIFHINDLHGQITEIPAEASDVSCLSRLADLIHSTREEFCSDPHQDLLSLSTGDELAGSIFDELMVENDSQLPTHPVYQLYSALQFDAVGLGNHDFDHGLDALCRGIQENAAFPVLAANIDFSPAVPACIHPAAVLVRKGVRIGLIGLVTRAEARLDPQVGRIVNPIPVAAKLVSLLDPFCDLLVILSHLGYSLENAAVPMADSGDVKLASSLKTGSVDLIIGGHTHSILNPDGFEPENLVNGIPIVQAGNRGEFIGQVDLAVNQGNAAVKHARLIPTAGCSEDLAFRERQIQALAAWGETKKGQLLGRVEGALEFSAAEVQRKFSSGEFVLANFVTDALYDQLRQRGIELDFVMLDGSAIQCGLSCQQSITYQDCFRIMPYADTVCLYSFTMEQLLALLEDNARRIGEPPHHPAHRGFLQFSRQIRYTIKAGSSPEKNEIQEVTFEGDPIKELSARKFTAATTCFTRKLSFAWEEKLGEGRFMLETFPSQDTKSILRHEIISHIQEQGGIPESRICLDGRLKILQ